MSDPLVLVSVLGLTLFCLVVTLAMVVPHYVNKWGAQINQTTEQSLADFLIFMPVAQLWMRILMASVVLFMVVALAVSVQAALISVVVLILGLPALKNYLLTKRRKIIDKQLPDFILLIANGSAAGLSFMAAIEASVLQLPIPLRYEVQLLVRRSRTGDSLADALNDFYRRVPTDSMMQWVTTVQLGLKHGAQQVAVMQRLATSLQQQAYARERLLSLSAQARLQGKVMLFLPIGLFFILRKVEPGNTALLTETGTGQAMLIGCAILMFIGNMIVKKIMGNRRVVRA
ncbi:MULTISPECIES: type II secretion system F family protein [Pseudidiomarina]|uniref:Flp pilus assembly protein TadB n=4 Tax=Pseudidiomarina TaxID=2800384 RepID=A0A368USF3_9GAMM|nr:MULTISPECIES: type II secretion system F family protein [Pseudidiomarina]MDT7526651.1 type II secretion system F family protein [Pseudidiomarina sp. GXY010]MDX1526656.1 type II secretion system F family protein [Pseudidiomarina maritima]PWW09858.1 Flp pilus assembly protein TadB [Pseudidiomarina maritima]RBP87786.1 Flp pilus assembly protein TadB [Pseudidiomarina tainanensis]RCW29781.1 Flp pilus assembly protein TadB [Pseudidiomarina tainanensis]